VIGLTGYNHRKIKFGMATSAQSTVSTKGWNWGSYEFNSDEMEFRVDNQRAFGIKYKDIALSSEKKNNEVALEFVIDGEE